MTKQKDGETLTCVKGFDAHMQCRGFQYEIGKTYTHDGEVKACESGLHACENPLDVLRYYAPADSLYAEVEVSGKLSHHEDDSKVAAASIHIKAMVTIPDIVSRAIAWITGRCDPVQAKHSEAHRSASSATGPSSASSATGPSSASSATGDRSASSATGPRSASSATGDASASSATGYSSASSATGPRSASSATGDTSASSATGYRSASSATGDRSASLATGYASSSEIKPDSEGKPLHAVAIATGESGKARAPAGSAIVLVERDPGDGSIVAIRASKVGENGVEPDKWYRLQGGEFVEADAT